MGQTPSSPHSIIEITEWVPNYRSRCEVCGKAPVVSGKGTDGKIAYKGTLCGVCTWGESMMSDPDGWNE